MTKTQIISAKVAAKISEGAAPIDALRMVCGAEVVDQMISDLYDELRTKAGA